MLPETSSLQKLWLSAIHPAGCRVKFLWPGSTILWSAQDHRKKILFCSYLMDMLPIPVTWHWLRQPMQPCDHPPLTNQDDTDYLERTSSTYTELKKIISDAKLMRVLPKLASFCHTGQLEVFHSFLLKYCQKRQYFPYAGTASQLNSQLFLQPHDWALILSSSTC